MNILTPKILLPAAAVLLIVSATAAVFFSVPLLCFLPLLCLILFSLIQYPAILFYLLLFSIPWSGEYNFSANLGTDLPDEPLMLLLAFAVMVLLAVQKQERRPHLLLVLLCAGMAWSVITVALSTHVWLSVKYLLAKTWYILAFVAAPLVLKADQPFIRRSALILFASMLLATGVVLVKHALLGFTFAQINEALAPFFRNHVNYSALLVMMVPLLIAFYRLNKRKAFRVVIAVSMGIVLLALFLSYARGAWLAFIVGLPAYWLIRKRWLLKAYLCSLFLLAATVFWLQSGEHYLRFAPQHDTTIFHNDFKEHLVATYQGKDLSTAERFYRWIAGARMGARNWLTGTGPTTFNQHYKSYAIPAFRTWVSDNKEQSTVHNYFLLLFIEQGAAGLLFFLILAGGMFWKAQAIYQRSNDPFWKLTAATIASLLWMQCTVNFLSDLIETDKVGSVFYLCLSFLIIADRKTGADQGTGKERNDQEKKGT